MISDYTKVKNMTDSSAELNSRMLNSIKLYIRDYRDTSFSKLNRKAALRSAIVLVQYIIEDLNVKIPQDEREILLRAFTKIHELLLNAEQNFDVLQDLKDVQGFISILEK